MIESEMGVDASETALVDPLLMVAVDGTILSAEAEAWLGGHRVGGITLYRSGNVEDAAQVRALTDALQAAAPGPDPLLVAIDQEGGQLLGLGEASTPFAGNMALGATGDERLAERVAHAIGLELRAVGINVNYAPVCDLASDPQNPSLGIRSFGDDPVAVGHLAAATVRGLRSAGVAATLKHFPGTGAAKTDPHFGLPTLNQELERLEAVELVPFRAGIDAGARLVMVGHADIPRVTGRPGLPSSLAGPVVDGLLRSRLGYEGVVITDALDMRALPQGSELPNAAVEAVRAGADLLLCPRGAADRNAIAAGLARALAERRSDRGRVATSAERVAEMRRWAGRERPDLDVVACAEHLELARELAERALTLVRDDQGLLPIRIEPDATVLTVMPRPHDRTPADTSGTVPPALADAIRTRHERVDGFVTSAEPDANEIAEVRNRAAGADLVVLGTIDAVREPAQVALVESVLATGTPCVTVALRTPFDLASYPTSRTHVCAYGLLRPSLDALVEALFARIPFRGVLPVAVPGLYERGHGLSAT